MVFNGTFNNIIEASFIGRGNDRETKENHRPAASH